MWSDKTKPTPANVRKRLSAALEALEGARVLAEKHGRMPAAMTRIRNAAEWALDAHRRAR